MIGEFLEMNCDEVNNVNSETTEHLVVELLYIIKDMNLKRTNVLTQNH